MTMQTQEQRKSATPAGDIRVDETASNSRQFVTFFSAGEVFAVDMAPVQEIIRLPQVVRIPMAPAALDGLANLRGKVLPIISLRRIFGFVEHASDEATRAVVIDVGQPLGFVVDRVASVVGVEPDQIEGVGSLSGTVDTELLSGMIKNVGGHAMIMILDFEKLIARRFASVAATNRTATAAVMASAGGANFDELASDELQLVSFSVTGQEYAIAIEDVQEIVQIPDDIIHVPHAEVHVVGVITLRSHLLPLVSLRRMFGLPDRAPDDKSRIIVLSLSGISVGVVVDGVSEVLRVSRSCVDPMPASFGKSNELTDISEICRLDDGKRLVSIIEVRRLFNHSAIKEALHAMNDVEENVADETAEDDLDDDEQMVVFRLGNEEFGVPINTVQEIVRIPEELIHVPTAADFVEGLINLRGSVLPVVDLRRRMRLPRIARSDGQRIMVFLVNNVRTGFIVDQVIEVLKIPKTSIEAAPNFSGDQKNLLSRMANMAKQQRLLQLLDPAYLVRDEELGTLAAAGASRL